MRSIKMLGAVILAALASGGVLSSIASAAEAEEQLLSGGLFPTKVEGTIGENKLAGITCTAGTNKGEVTSSRAGTITLDLTGCKALGFPCNSKGDAKEVILTSGTFETVFDALGGPLLPAHLVTLSETTVECTPLVKIVIKGSFLLLFNALTSGTDVTEIAFIVEQEGEGKPTDKSYWIKTNEPSAKKPQLLASTNGLAFAEASVAWKANKTKYSSMMALVF